MGKETTKMSNSPLVNYTKISPNKTSPRKQPIDTITIHCVVGQCTVGTLGNVFAPATRQASSNYGVGYDGRIGMYCEEKDRSWCTSSSANDNRAITIEVASDTTHPYAVTDKALAALIELCADICKRNGIKRLLWKGDKNLIGQPDKQNMTVHRWFANKSCPGDYLYERHGYIADEVNKRLGAANTPPPPSSPSTPGTLYYVQTGAYSVKANADAQYHKVKAKGFDAIIKKAGITDKLRDPKDNDSRKETFLSFRQKELRKDKSGNMVANQPIKVVDAGGNKWDETKMIGNGTIADVKFTVKDNGKGRPKGVYIQAIRVLQHVPYEVQEFAPLSSDDEYFAGSEGSPAKVS